MLEIKKWKIPWIHRFTFVQNSMAFWQQTHLWHGYLGTKISTHPIVRKSGFWCRNCEIFNVFSYHYHTGYPIIYCTSWGFEWPVWYLNFLDSKLFTTLELITIEDLETRGSGIKKYSATNNYVCKLYVSPINSKLYIPIYT